MASVYSGAGEGRYGTVTVKGQVEFGLQYNYKQGALEIHVVQCKDLAAVDTKRNRSDPYVKVSLAQPGGLPHIIHTKCLSETPNNYNELSKECDTYMVEVSYTSFTHTLQFGSFYNSDFN